MNRIITTLIGLMLAAAVHAQEAPDALIKRVAGDVIATLKSDKDLAAGNKQKLYSFVESKIATNFDFTRMTALAMGRNWQKATPEQQKQIADEFKTLLVRTYSGALANYRNNTIDYKPVQAKANETDTVVRTQVLQPAGQPIPIDYSVTKTPEGWKAYDITVGGVSLVTNYREEFNTIIRDKGVDGLVRELAAKNKA